MIVNGQTLLAEKPIKDMIGTKERIHGLSYGLSEVGYDFRIKQEVKFTAPRIGFFLKVLREGLQRKYQPHELEKMLQGSVTVTEPDGTSTQYVGRTAIGSSIEEFQIPNHLWAEFRNKSTHARRFLDASLGTDGEPGWCGHLTIEMVFQGNDDYVLPAGCPILKAVFHELTERSEYSGKYQNQPDRPIPAIFERTES